VRGETTAIEEAAKRAAERVANQPDLLAGFTGLPL
jgi:hypothetical protein